jgi:hypothetical protein
MAERISREQAIKLAESEWWKKLSPKEAVLRQLNVDTIIMPYPLFHKMVEKVLNRPVLPCEFGNPRALINEINGEKPSRSEREVLREFGNKIGTNLPKTMNYKQKRGK